MAEEEKPRRRRRRRKDVKKIGEMEASPVREPREPRPVRKRRPKPVKKTSKAVKWVVGALACLGIVWAYQASAKKKAEQLINDRYNMSLTVLDKAYMGCKGFWMENSSYDPCPDPLINMALGKYKDEMELKILKTRSHAFSVQAKHKDGDKNVQVNEEGTMFLIRGDGLAEVRFVELTAKDVASLERQCK